MAHPSCFHGKRRHWDPPHLPLNPRSRNPFHQILLKEQKDQHGRQELKLEMAGYLRKLLADRRPQTEASSMTRQIFEYVDKNIQNISILVKSGKKQKGYLQNTSTQRIIIIEVIKGLKQL